MQFQESLLGGFITTTSKIHKGSYTITCLRPNSTIKMIITVGAQSRRILRVEISSPTIKKFTTKTRIPDLISIVKCGCVECIKILKEWNNDSKSS